MKRSVIISISAALLLTTSCVDTDMYRPADKIVDPSQLFDFNTTKAVKVNLKYGDMAAGALLEFYTAYPMESHEDGSFELKGEPFYKIYTDSKGSFSGDVVLPTTSDKLYIYSPSWGAPMLVEANIEKGRVDVDKTVSFTSRATTRVDGETDFHVYPIAGQNGLYALWSSYDSYGNVMQTIDSRLVSEGNLAADFYTKLQYILWNKQTTKPTGLNNTSYLRDASVVNTDLLAVAKDPASGETVTINNAEIYFTLVGEAGWFESGIGYYYYKTSEGEPSDPSKVKRIFILPNISIPYQAPYGVATRNGYVIDSDLAPANVNTRVKLLFVDDDGVAHDSFPPGYTIGYFVLPAAFGDGTDHKETIQYNKGFIYSNDHWNTDQRKRFIALQTADGSLVYGCEDGQDSSCEDILFCISGSPNYAIEKDEDLPSIDITAVDELYNTQTTMQTYAFEDIWPDGGDYDLNDVIVEHKRLVTFNQKNYVSKIVDEFTPVQPAGSATYVDAFAVQYKKSQTGNITLPENAINEPETGSTIIFTDAKAVKGKTFTVTREFVHSLTNGLPKTTFDGEDYNPFIISQYVPNDQSRTEIHMPKAKATVYADPNKIGAKDDSYYINSDGMHPFSITIPIMGWQPVPESKKIGNHYTKFDGWVQSRGRENTDWYLRP